MALLLTVSTAGCDPDGGGDPQAGGEDTDAPAGDSEEFYYQLESPLLGGDALGLGLNRAFVAGGRQTMTLHRAYEPTGNSEPVVDPFDLAIDKEGWEVLDVTPPTFQIRAGTGSASLDLVGLPGALEGHPSDTALHAAPIASIAGGACLEWKHSQPWAFFVGGPRALYVELRDEDGEPLVDEDLELDLPVGGGQRLAWDVVEVSSDEAGKTGLTVTASDGIERALSVQWVDAVDELFALEEPVTTSVGETFQACFAGRAGDTIVHGLDWSFEGTGPFEVSYDPTPTAGSPGRHCATVEGSSVGQGTLTARAADREVTVQVWVDPADQG